MAITFNTTVLFILASICIYSFGQGGFMKIVTDEGSRGIIIRTI
ncbi:MAG: hypothetical protein PHC29_08285 [Candidatus Omnitrophica bacterium]|nr:hypothetical protein [Candidatus Omnitrophota bacterium]